METSDLGPQIKMNVQNRKAPLKHNLLASSRYQRYYTFLNPFHVMMSNVPENHFSPFEPLVSDCLKNLKSFKTGFIPAYFMLQSKMSKYL